jgi:serine/threonine protein kinase
LALLRRRQQLTSDVSGHTYRLTSGLLAKGGFGEVYKAEQLDGERAKVCIKATTDAVIWHGEAYFGRLLVGQRSVVRLLDAFPLVIGRGLRRHVRYLLVFEWMAGGTVDDQLQGPRQHWPEERVAQQIQRVLKVLALLHQRGICHGDITPRNVFIRRLGLVLGDLGLVSQSLQERGVTLPGHAPATYVPPWPELRYTLTGFHWTPSADVYQVALIALTLLSGSPVEAYEMRGKLLRAAPVSDDIKAWLFTAFGLGGSRYLNAGEALRYFRNAAPRKMRPPRSLREAKVVFTGSFKNMTQPEAARLARRGGASVQDEVNNQTTLLVRGLIRQGIGSKAGGKLIDARHRILDGQRIAILDESQFEAVLHRDQVA